MTHRDRGGNLLELAELTALEHSAPSAGAGLAGCPPRGLGPGKGAPRPTRCLPAGAGVLGPQGVSATQVVKTGRMRQFGALIVNMEKNSRKLYSIFPVKVYYSTQNKRKKAGGRPEHRPPPDQP